MRALTVDVKQSTGRILCCTIFKSCGRKLLSKGHILSEDDVRLLETEGLGQVWVTELDPGEVSEDQAVQIVSTEMGCGSLEIRLAVGGRANVFATERCCALVDDELLKQINCTTSIVIGTVPNFSYHGAGDRLATVKSAPFAVAGEELEIVSKILRERGPILQGRPIRRPSVGVLYSDPVSGDRARVLFENVVRQRLERFQLGPAICHSVCEDDNAIAQGINRLMRENPTLIMIASTTAPAGPEDPVGRGMAIAGCQIERFLAPVEPGNLFLLGYRNDIPVISAPGCFRSAKPNILDLVMPPLLARYRVSGWEIAGLGHGGLMG